jgi:hypothetical protein
MGQAIPSQNPAVVLRSHYRQLRTLLTIALVMVIGLSAALVIVATEDESTTTTATSAQSLEDSLQRLAGRNGGAFAAPQVAEPGQPIEYGGFNPQTGRPLEKVATPDESKIAAAISGAQQAGNQSGPDESSVAAAIAPDTGEPSVSQAHPGARP